MIAERTRARTRTVDGWASRHPWKLRTWSPVGSDEGDQLQNLPAHPAPLSYLIGAREQTAATLAPARSHRVRHVPDACGQHRDKYEGHPPDALAPMPKADN